MILRWILPKHLLELMNSQGEKPWIHPPGCWWKTVALLTLSECWGLFVKVCRPCDKLSQVSLCCPGLAGIRSSPPLPFERRMGGRMERWMTFPGTVFFFSFFFFNSNPDMGPLLPLLDNCKHNMPNKWLHLFWWQKRHTKSTCCEAFFLSLLTFSSDWMVVASSHWLLKDSRLKMHVFFCLVLYFIFLVLII